MRSIGKKILRITLSWMIILIFLMTAISVYVVTRLTDEDSRMLISQLCEEETLRFNDEFRLLENSVTTISDYIRDLEKKTGSTDDLLSDEFCSRVEDMTISIANRTDGAMAVYFRYDPELTGNGTQGFFWSRDNNNDPFTRLEPTDILQYDPDDTEHVGWFYIPKEQGEAMWMSPYYNKNLDVFMISYVIPYYTQSGVFLGIIGMDIDFNKIVELTEDIQLYDSGRTSLYDMSDGLVFSATGSGTISQENADTSFYEELTGLSGNNEVSLLKAENGTLYLICSSTLSNGMQLMLYVPKSETEATRNTLFLIFLLIMAAALVITIPIIIRFTGRIIKPLQILTRITGNYAKGDWAETFTSNTGDEIQQLSESISVMAEMTKSYIDKIHASAMTDSLTGLKNKNCYLSYIERYSGEQQKEHERYAIAVMDINYLKKMNDIYGHEKGDALIKTAGKFICGIFSHSPVFRIGGDEYVAIMEHSDFLRREELLQNFQTQMQTVPPIVDEVPLSISIGMAERPTDGDDYDSLFKLADSRMYLNKKKIKGSLEEIR